MTSTRIHDIRGPARSGDPVAEVVLAVWCRSVGSFRALELHELGEDLTSGTIKEWITTIVPIWQPTPPEALTRRLLADRRLTLFPHLSASACSMVSCRCIWAASRGGVESLLDLPHAIGDLAAAIGAVSAATVPRP